MSCPLSLVYKASSAVWKELACLSLWCGSILFFGLYIAWDHSAYGSLWFDGNVMQTKWPIMGMECVTVRRSWFARPIFFCAWLKFVLVFWYLRSILALSLSCLFPVCVSGAQCASGAWTTGTLRRRGSSSVAMTTGASLVLPATTAPISSPALSWSVYTCIHTDVVCSLFRKQFSSFKTRGMDPVVSCLSMLTIFGHNTGYVWDINWSWIGVAFTDGEIRQ